MKKQYKEYKVVDIDISEMLLCDEKKFYSFENEVESIEEINELEIKEMKKYILNKIENAEFINFLEKLCRNRLLKIIPYLVLDEKECSIYTLLYREKETQAEIGKQLGITRQAVNKTVKKIDKKFESAAENVRKYYINESC